MKKYLLALVCTSSILLSSNAQPINIIPEPQSIKPGGGSFTLTSQTSLCVADTTLNFSANFLNDYLQKFYGFKLPLSSTKPTSNYLAFSIDPNAKAVTGAYNLQVTAKGIDITAHGKEGIFYGIQSLLQLVPAEKATSFKIPVATIEDEPAFGYRGLHLDVCRHFFDVAFVKRYIDFIAAFKLNTFHWHLTDDQGWRIEIKKYPLLTSVGGWRNGTIIGHHPGVGNDDEKTGGFYTQEEIRDVVKYAQDRMITVIPEIEMPGHASAAIAAYPFLSCFPEEKTDLEKTPSKTSIAAQASGQVKLVQETWGVFPDVFAPTPQTFSFLEDVLDEVLTLFPSKYIHIGGDECPKDNWKRSAYCQELIKEKNLKDEHGLQSYFISTIEAYLNGKGRSIIGWDEILEGGLAPNATVMSWRGEQGGIDAAKQDHDVIMTPGEFLYFDHAELKPSDSLTIGGFLPIKTVYNYHPKPAALSAEQAQHILGAQANLWTEYIASPEKLEYMLFPRLAALSEMTWTKDSKKDYNNFVKKMPSLTKKLDIMQINYNAKALKVNK